MLCPQVIGQVEVAYMESKLAEVIPGVTRGYCHSESSVRKASVFCLVALHGVVGDKMKEHLHKLSSSQVSLATPYLLALDLVSCVWSATCTCNRYICVA